MKNIFKPEEFAKINGTDIHIQHCDYVNRKLNALIEAAPVVYGYGETPGASSMWNMNGPEKERGPHTHKARLMFIEELVKEPCKHKPMPNTVVNLNEVICSICGIELKATWEAK